MRLGFKHSTSPVRVLISAWKEDHIIYHHHLLYVIGLVFSHFLARYAFSTISTLYFTNYGSDLATSAILTGIQNSLASFSVIILGHAASSYVGKFPTVLLSTIAYMGGLLLFWKYQPYHNKWLVGAALVLLALGEAKVYILDVIVIDLLHDIDKSAEHDIYRSTSRAKIWSVIATVSAAISAVLWVAPGALLWAQLTWKTTPLVCSITLAITLVIFCTGYNVYSKDKFTQRASWMFFRVFLVCIKKLLKYFSSRIVDGKMETTGNEGSAQDISPQDQEIEMTVNGGRAQDGSPLHIDTNGNEDDNGSSSYKEDLVVVKSLLRMYPMWLTFLVVSIISTTGNTFFYQQYSNLNTNNQIVFQLYSFVKGLSSHLISSLYGLVCGKCWIPEKERVKIGVGMLFGFLSCVLAWQLEVHRLKAVSYLNYEDENTSISFLWLVLQFCMLGCMEGLVEEGFLNFYKSQITSEPVKYYGVEYMETVQGYGQLFYIILIFSFKIHLGWFGHTINDSRVDNYYEVLMFVAAVNFIVYCCIARYFYEDGEQYQDSASE